MSAVQSLSGGKQTCKRGRDGKRGDVRMSMSYNYRNDYRTLAVVRKIFNRIKQLGRRGAFPLDRTMSVIGGYSEVSALHECFAV